MGNRAIDSLRMVRIHHHLLLSLLLDHLLFGQPVDSQVTCTAGAFTVGERAKVTCHFKQNITAARRNFNVVYYAFKPVEDAGNYVLLCNWARHLECSSNAGYRFDKEALTNDLTLDIPSVTEGMSGQYVCQMVPDNGVRSEPCNLTVEATITLNNTAADPNYTTSPGAYFQPSNSATITLNNTAADPNYTTSPGAYFQPSNSDSKTGLIVSLVIFILLSAILLGILLFICKTFRFERKDNYSTWIPFGKIFEPQTSKTTGKEQEADSIAANYSSNHFGSTDNSVIQIHNIDKVACGKIEPESLQKLLSNAKSEVISEVRDSPDSKPHGFSTPTRNKRPLKDNSKQDAMKSTDDGVCDDDSVTEGFDIVDKEMCGPANALGEGGDPQPPYPSPKGKKSG